MLYDPKWEQQTKVSPLSLESLIAWLEKQPADGKYDFPNIRGCLICKYLDAMGIRYHSAGREDFARPEPHLGRQRLEGDWASVTMPQPWTFGAALERARAALAHS